VDFSKCSTPSARCARCAATTRRRGFDRNAAWLEIERPAGARPVRAGRRVNDSAARSETADPHHLHGRLARGGWRHRAAATGRRKPRLLRPPPRTPFPSRRRRNSPPDELGEAGRKRKYARRCMVGARSKPTKKRPAWRRTGPSRAHPRSRVRRWDRSPPRPRSAATINSRIFPRAQLGYLKVASRRRPARRARPPRRARQAVNEVDVIVSAGAGSAGKA